MSTQHTQRLIDSGNLADDELYRALDELYSRGWKDRSQEQDYDPRGTTQWQAVLDLFRYQRDELLAENDRMRRLLINALYYSQGANSLIGQPIRQFLGMGRFDHMTADQLAIAKAMVQS